MAPIALGYGEIGDLLAPAVLFGDHHGHGLAGRVFIDGEINAALVIAGFFAAGDLFTFLVDQGDGCPIDGLTTLGDHEIAGHHRPGRAGRGGPGEHNKTDGNELQTPLPHIPHSLVKTTDRVPGQAHQH